MPAHTIIDTHFRKMDYDEIPDEYRKYVRESSYTKLDDDERKAYLKGVKYAAKKFAKEMDELINTSEMRMCIEVMKIVPLFTEVSFVGIKGCRRHVFDYDDEVKLERDDDDPEDPNAIRVFVKKNNVWKHVVYVVKDDAMELRK